MVGATGAVGETLIRVLEERRIPIDRLGVFASHPRSRAARFRGDLLDVAPTSEEALQPYSVVFFAGGEGASERFVPSIVDRGAVVIDNSATFRMREDVPLLIPEINGGVAGREHRIFPVANCTAIILCMALAPLREVAGLRAVRVATYQAVSGAGKAALEAFDRAEGNVVRNVVPHVGAAFDENGESGEERKVREETRKMLALPDLFVSSMCVRVPVRTAHSEAVFFETERETSIEEMAEAFERAPSVVFHRDGIVTPREVEGSDEVHVARLRTEIPYASLDLAQRSRASLARDDKSKSPGRTAGRYFSLWCVGDQLRKGAATNAVQILELLMAKGYVR